MLKIVKCQLIWMLVLYKVVVKTNRLLHGRPESHNESFMIVVVPEFDKESLSASKSVRRKMFFPIFYVARAKITCSTVWKSGHADTCTSCHAFWKETLLMQTELHNHDLL